MFYNKEAQKGAESVGAGILPILGMLMLPKTVCYILLIISFLRVVT